MATITDYAATVTSSEFPDASDAAGEPTAGEAAPYATFTGAGAAVLTGAFAARSVPGIITAFSLFILARDGVVSRSCVFSGTNLTFASATDFTSATFVSLADSATFNAATLKAAIIAGQTGMVATFEAGLSTTIDAKGFGRIITYTPTGPIDGGDEDTTYRICRTLVSGIVLP